MKGEEKSLIISCDKNRTSIKNWHPCRRYRNVPLSLKSRNVLRNFCVDESFSFYIQTKRLFESESKVV